MMMVVVVVVVVVMMIMIMMMMIMMMMMMTMDAKIVQVTFQRDNSVQRRSGHQKRNLGV